MKVLIVDDSALIRMAIETYLSNRSFEIVGQAADGKSALRIFEEKRPELVTMDITMPEMDGLECMEEILKIDPAVKVLIITAVSKKGIAIEALNKGAKFYIHKPFTEEELIAAFEKVTAGT